MADIARISRNARTVAFPMVDPFGPVLKARIPVPGLNRFPGRYNRLGRRYYLGDGPVLPVNAPINGERNVVVNAGDEGNEENFRGLGFTVDPSTIPINAGGGSGVLSQILGTLNNILPATISAIKGKPYYNTGVYTSPIYSQGVNLGGEQTGAGADIGSQVGAGVGNIGDTLGRIVAQHPYLVLAGVAGAFLLFSRPPGRR